MRRNFSITDPVINGVLDNIIDAGGNASKYIEMCVRHYVTTADIEYITRDECIGLIKTYFGRYGACIDSPVITPVDIQKDDLEDIMGL